MKTIGPARAADGETEVAMVFSVDPKTLHKTLMTNGEDDLCKAINYLIKEEYNCSYEGLFTVIRDLVMIKQSQIEATGQA